MRFIKEHLDNIVKLFVNQIGISIFAMFLYTAASAVEFADPSKALTIKIAISVFSILFYFFLIYNVTWEIGAKDKIKIDGKRLERKPSKGILLGVYSNLINYVFVGSAFLLFAIYMMTGAEVLKSIFAVMNLIFRLFLSIYLGAIQGIFSFVPDGDTLYLLETLGYLIFCGISAVIIHVSYIMGLSERKFFGIQKRK
jgi:hypothetical protein